MQPINSRHTLCVCVCFQIAVSLTERWGWTPKPLRLRRCSADSTSPLTIGPTAFSPPSGERPWKPKKVLFLFFFLSLNFAEHVYCICKDVINICHASIFILWSLIPLPIMIVQKWTAWWDTIHYTKSEKKRSPELQTELEISEEAAQRACASPMIRSRL